MKYTFQEIKKLFLNKIQLLFNKNEFYKIGIIIFISFLIGSLVAYFECSALYIMIFIFLFFIVFINPYLGLFFVIIFFPFAVGFSKGIDIKEQIYALLFGIWLIGWIVHQLIYYSGKFNFKWHPIYKCTLAISVLLFIAALIGLLTGSAFVDVLRDLSQYIGYLMFLPVVTIILNKKSAMRIFKIMFFIGLPCYIWTFFIWWARKFGSEYGVLNILGIGSSYFGPIIGSLWPLMVLKTGRRVQLLATLGIILFFCFSAGSGYRSQILYFIIMTCISVWYIWNIQSGKEKISVFIPLIIGVIFIFWIIFGTLGYLPLPGGEGIKFIYSSLLYPSKFLSDISIQGRIVEAQAALKVFFHYPLFGQGLGHHVEMNWEHGSWYKFAFSQHLWPPEMLMKFGIFGSFVFLWYFISIIKLAYVIAKKTDDYLIKSISLGVVIWIITSLIPGLGSFSDRGFAFTTGLIIGILPTLAKTPIKSEKGL